VNGSLNCPSCGASAAVDALRCGYCGSALKTVTCPSCFASMFTGSEYCPHCGSKAAQAVEDSNAPLPCPNCSATMKPVRVGATSMQQCDTCAGSWLATDVFTSLCTDREAQAAVTAVFGAKAGAPPSQPRLGEVRYRHCAVCKNMMNRVNFGRVSGVVIDLCKGHGVWFDPGELSRALSFVAGGGLNRMRESEAEFKRLSKQAWTTSRQDAASAPVMTQNTNVSIRFTATDNDGDALTRRLLDFLLT
jgi:Zn-finger nucleic acid-binding protein